MSGFMSKFMSKKAEFDRVNSEKLQVGLVSPGSAYFESLPDKILQRIEKQSLENDKKLAFTLRNSEKFKVGLASPGSAYFEDLPEKILQGIEKQSLENARNLEFDLRNSEKFHIGLVPPDPAYFEGLTEKILQRIEKFGLENAKLNPAKLGNSELGNSELDSSELYNSELYNANLVTSKGDETFYSVPQLYFDNLPDQIFHRILVEKQNTPQEFSFVKHPPIVEKKIFTVKSIFERRSTKGFIHLLAAASVTLLFLFIGLDYKGKLVEKKFYAQLNQEERLKYRYGVDESVLEDELVSNDDVQNNKNLDPSAEIHGDILGGKKANNLNDRYLLHHTDDNTLFEEL